MCSLRFAKECYKGKQGQKGGKIKTNMGSSYLMWLDQEDLSEEILFNLMETVGKSP